MIRLLFLFLLGAAGPDAAAAAQERTVTLDECLSAALQVNPALRQAEAGIVGAEARRKSVRGGFGASVTLDGNVMRWNQATKLSLGSSSGGVDLSTLPPPDSAYEQMIAGMLSSFSGGTVLQEQVTTQLSLTVVQPITPLWSVYKAYRLAGLAVDLAKLQRDEAARSVAYAVVSAYLSVLQAQAVHEAITESVDRVTEHLNKMKELQAAEQVAPADVLKMDVALAQVQQTEVSLRNVVMLAQSNLTTQVGWGPGTEVQVAPLSLELPEPPAFTLEEAFKLAESRRPELAELRRAKDQALQAKDLTYQAFIPTVAGVGTAKHVTGSSMQEENSWYVGLTMSWPLWQWGSSYYLLDEANANIRKVEQGYEQARNYVLLEVKKAWLDLSSSLEELKVAKRGIDQAEENYRMQKLMYEAEYMTSTDLIDAEAALTQARSQYNVTFWKAHQAWAALRKAMGGTVEAGLVADQGGQE